MDNLNNELLKLSCFEPEILFKKLADFSAISQDLEKMPIISLALSAGQIFNGRLIKYDEASRNATLVIATDNATNAQAYFINLRHVVAVNISNITQHAHHFSEGRIEVPVYFEKITKLGYKKVLTELADKINRSANLSMEIHAEYDATHFETDLNNYTIKKLADTMYGALNAVIEDPLGKEALSTQIKSISLVNSEVPVVKLEDSGVLKISINPSKGESGSYDIKSLQAAIEEQL